MKMKEEQEQEQPKTMTGRVLQTLSLAPKIRAMVLRSKLTDDDDLANFLAKTASLTIYSFIGVTTLGTFGIDTSAIIAGFGVTGFAIGFAFKEILTNFLSGIFLLFQRPFSKGAFLKIHGSGSGIEGRVEAIDIRYVHLKAETEGGIIKIPSAIVYSNPITVINGLIAKDADMTPVADAIEGLPKPPPS